jgi:hypothetical protein
MNTPLPARIAAALADVTDDGARGAPDQPMSVPAQLGVASEPAAESRVPATLIAAYRSTHYCVNGVSPPFLLRVDEANSDLAACHRAYGVDSSAFVTAWNPGSRPKTDEENQAAQQTLRDLLGARGFALLEGLGIDPTGQWGGEESLLVLGIGREAACEVGRTFRQHGIVWSDADCVPRLVLLE